LLACSAPGSGGGTGPTTGSGDSAAIQLQLTTVASSGNVYRLGPATFEISGPATQTVDASGDDNVLHVPTEPGDYQVTLKPEWVLDLVKFGNSTPVAATLVSQPVQFVRVSPFQVTPISYAFHLGESGIDIGISVDEGAVPPGYDGAIQPLGDGRYSVTFASGGGACCFDSVAEAQAAYPQFNLFVQQ